MTTKERPNKISWPETDSTNIGKLEAIKPVKLSATEIDRLTATVGNHKTDDANTREGNK